MYIYVFLVQNTPSYIFLCLIPFAFTFESSLVYISDNYYAEGVLFSSTLISYKCC